MMEYNQSLQKAGELLGLDGLLPPSTGAHVSYTAPMAENEIIEVRQIYKMGDFSADVQKAVEGFEELPNGIAEKA
jgi:hypothetical protein